MKALTIVFLKKAIAQLDKEKEYYHQKLEGLEDGLVSEVFQALNLLSSFPILGPLRHRGQRVYILKRFPYLVFYKVQNDKLIVVKIIHKSRHPKHWKK